ncbi:Spo0E like sporulation regulatory protein [Natranaerovirga hydrolytica]|uniref:Spo0E like sporulation regulatory protein n=1 Tax=Natranaerovirga hydrolytica TaxID=680378 RepID=A0A4R1MXC5_9FIRM|nr:Spo0E family sporulation regulatory protein-aspartic acid phosphatase [Natranaerovirga hydrolytica]TCK97856.1 Spo0E like sporulation regulatory protein [Natranaerovirga hydrolytica]
MEDINQSQVEQMRQKLHDLIEKNASYEEIYEASIELDLLIAEYIKPLEKAN